MDRARVSKGYMPCITPGGAFWLRRRQRLACGGDKLRVQGAWLPNYSNLADFSDPALQDLAGNMFCSCSATKVILAVFCNLLCEWK